MAETKPIPAYDVLYVSNARYYGDHGDNVGESVPDATRQDLYPTYLVFVAAKVMKGKGKSVKVALLGDAVYALHPKDVRYKPKPERHSQSTLEDEIKALGAEIYY